MSTEIDIPQVLKDHRKKRSYTQEDVAIRLGIKRSTYGAYEEGRATPSVGTMIRLSHLYNYNSVEDFLEGKKPRQRGVNGTQPELVIKYNSLSQEKRKIVDFILNSEP